MSKDFSISKFKTGHMILTLESESKSHLDFSNATTTDDLIRGVVAFNPVSDFTIGVERYIRIILYKYQYNGDFFNSWNPLSPIVMVDNNPCISFNYKHLIVAILEPKVFNYVMEFEELSGYNPIYVNKNNKKGLKLFNTLCNKHDIKT